MILGKININTLLCIAVPAMILTPLYTYHIAVSKGEQPPFPHATVTSTAEHYPQSIVFRFVMLFCSSVLALTFYCLFRWIQWQAQRVHFPPPPKYMFYLAQSSILCYGITIGTIDGHGGGKLHGPNAVIFFIVWLVTIVNVTFYIRKLRIWDTSVIGKLSLTLKLVLSVYIALIWVWCLYGLLTTPDNKKSDIYVVIV